MQRVVPVFDALASAVIAPADESCAGVDPLAIVCGPDLVDVYQVHKGNQGIADLPVDAARTLEAPYVAVQASHEAL